MPKYSPIYLALSGQIFPVQKDPFPYKAPYIQFPIIMGPKKAMWYEEDEPMKAVTFQMMEIERKHIRHKDYPGQDFIGYFAKCENAHFIKILVDEYNSKHIELDGAMLLAENELKQKLKDFPLYTSWHMEEYRRIFLKIAEPAQRIQKEIKDIEITLPFNITE